jgi:hypothetical protein
LPSVYVGASANGFVVRQNGRALKLRLDGEAQPNDIELMDDTNGTVFSF